MCACVRACVCVLFASVAFSICTDFNDLHVTNSLTHSAFFCHMMDAAEGGNRLKLSLNQVHLLEVPLYDAHHI